MDSGSTAVAPAKSLTIFWLAGRSAETGSDQVQGKIVQDRAVVEHMIAFDAEAVARELSSAECQIARPAHLHVTSDTLDGPHH